MMSLGSEEGSVLVLKILNFKPNLLSVKGLHYTIVYIIFQGRFKEFFLEQSVQ